MTAKEVKVICKFEGIYRKAIIKTSAINDSFTVWFYFNGYQDYEWKRGANGIAMDSCKTLDQAKGKAKRYIEKDYR